MTDGVYELRKVDVRIKLVDEVPLFSRTPIDTPARAMEVVRRALSEMDREYCAVVNLDTTGRPLNFNIVSVGDLNKTSVPMQNVFKSAILSNAHSIMMFHNHPDGVVLPSRADLMVTANLIEAGNLMNIPVKDHIIVGGGNKDFYSMREHHKGMFEVQRNYALIPRDIAPTERLAQEAGKYDAGSYVNVMDYARSKGTDVHIINGYISAHREEFKGHIAKGKNAAALDEWAQQKLDVYIANRPDKGLRFHRFEQKEMVMGRDILEKTNEKSVEKASQVLYGDMQKTVLSLHEPEDLAYGDTELGADAPDLVDGADARDTVVSAKPSRNIHKSRVNGAKHYSFPTGNDEIENMKETEKMLTEEPMKEIDTLDIEDPEFDDMDALERD
nr:JAB domain-containing protein [uncultured Butyrivibrio sp.]